MRRRGSLTRDDIHTRRTTDIARALALPNGAPSQTATAQTATADGQTDSNTDRHSRAIYTTISALLRTKAHEHRVAGQAAQLEGQGAPQLYAGKHSGVRPGSLRERAGERITARRFCVLCDTTRISSGYGTTYFPSASLSLSRGRRSTLGSASRQKGRVRGPSYPSVRVKMKN